MALIVRPNDKIDMVVGEEYAYELDISEELGSKTVDSYTYKIYNSSDEEITSTFGGGSVYLSMVITFGIKAVSSGRYSSVFIVTCEDLLPDGITPYEFYVTLYIIID